MLFLLIQLAGCRYRLIEVSFVSLSLAVPSKTICKFLYNYVTYQDNEPLMRALSKLINLNNPDLVLFVGEALVGNDAVDQLSKFNQVLIFLWLTDSCFS